MTDRVHLDYETFSELSLPNVGVGRYSRHPSTEALMCAWSLNDVKQKQWVPAEGEDIPRDFKEALEDPHVIKWAWNAPFEINITRNVLGINTPLESWRDTMVLALTCSLPGKLEKAGPVVDLPEDKQKSAKGRRLMKKFSEPRKPTKTKPNTRVYWYEDYADWREYLDYNDQDETAEYAIWQKLKPYMPSDEEWALWHLDQRINEAGIPINMRMVRNAITIYETTLRRKLLEMQEITGLENANSGPQLLPWLQEQGYPFDDLKKGHITRALEYCHVPPDHWNEEAREAYGANSDLERVLSLRAETSRTSPKKFHALRRAANVDPDDPNFGVLRYAFQFAGAARTWRWGGRLFQPQNLPRPIKKLEKGIATHAKNVEKLDTDSIDLIYDKPMDLLASCIRPAAQAPDGYLFIDADLNAIENRVLGWLAGCEKILRVFRLGRDPYLSFATYLYNEPYEKLLAEYKAGDGSKRTIAKPGTLGCGYMLGAGDVRINHKTGEKEATGLLGYAWNMHVTEFTKEQSVLSVETFRREFLEVKDYWYGIEKAAKRCIRTGKTVEFGYIRFDRKGPFMRMILPSGRPLHYCRPRIEDVKAPWGEIKPTITYETLNDKKQWVRESTHPGKLTENCWNSDTLILTDSGVKRIVEVTRTDRIWDGLAWVRHEGVVFSGVRETVELGGARVTPEHRIEVDGHWREACSVSADAAASSFERYYGSATWEAIGERAARIGRPRFALADRLRLRGGSRAHGVRVPQGPKQVVRLRSGAVDFAVADDPRNDETPGLPRVALHARSVQQPEASCLPQLRRPGHKGLREVVSVRGVLGGHGADIQTRFDDRAEEQQPGLLEGELRVAGPKGAGAEHALQSHGRYAEGPHDDRGSRRDFGHRQDDAAVPLERRVPEVADVRPSEHREQVYDILNCGPRSAFTVVLPDGRMLLSHNCDQAISRDLLAHGMKLAARRGLDLRIHVHDQLVGLVREHEAEAKLKILIESMEDQPKWAPGLPLGSNGFISKVFMKD